MKYVFYLIIIVHIYLLNRLLEINKIILQGSLDV